MQHLHDEFRYPLNKKALSDFLKKEMREKRIHQTDLAKEIGVSRPTLHRWLHEKFGEIECGNLKLISRYLGISFDECFDRFTTEIVIPTPQDLDRFVQTVNRLDELVERMEKILLNH